MVQLRTQQIATALMKLSRKRGKEKVLKTDLNIKLIIYLFLFNFLMEVIKKVR